jgi:uncharacterized OsmC-like protein
MMDEIRTALDGARAYLTAHPAEASYTDSAATAVLMNGLAVGVSGPSGESLTTDMSRSVGGAGSAPSPGWLFRAAIASCAATLIAMRAASAGQALSRLEVVVDSESDDRGILGLDESVPAGPLSCRITVRVTARGAARAEIAEIVRWGIDHCPVVDAVRRPVPASIVLEIGD